MFWTPTWNSIVTGYQLRTIPDELLGRVMSVTTLLSFSTTALGPLVVGVLLQATAPEEVFRIFAVYVLGIAISGTLSRSLRRVPEPGPAAAADGR
jgi:hypothetical protein